MILKNLINKKIQFKILKNRLNHKKFPHQSFSTHEISYAHFVWLLKLKKKLFEWAISTQLNFVKRTHVIFITARDYSRMPLRSSWRSLGNDKICEFHNKLFLYVSRNFNFRNFFGKFVNLLGGWTIREALMEN